jgi:fructokinase
MTETSTTSAAVIVIGEALIDVVHGNNGTVESPGGSPANVALGLGRLGVDVALLTHLADDDYGRRIVRRLTDSHVRLLPESFGAASTPRAIADVAPDGQANYWFQITWDIEAPVLPASSVLLHTGSIAAFLPPGSGAIGSVMRSARGKEVTFDPNIRPSLIGSHHEALQVFEEFAALSTVVKMSDDDARWLYPGLDPTEVLKMVLARGPNIAVMTLGAAGSLLANSEGTVSVPPTLVRAVDTIGAGDTYMASLIADLLDRPSHTASRDDLIRFGRRAAHAASITVTRVGADLPYLSEL